MIGIIRNHIEGLLEEGGIKLTAVATDPLGVSGWAMLRLLAKGEADVKVLAAEARGGMRKKNAQLEEALAGKWNPERIPRVDEAARYWFLRKQRLEQIELLRRQIGEIHAELGG